MLVIYLNVDARLKITPNELQIRFYVVETKLVSVVDIIRYVKLKTTIDTILLPVVL